MQLLFFSCNISKSVKEWQFLRVEHMVDSTLYMKSMHELVLVIIKFLNKSTTIIIKHWIFN